MTTSSAPFEAQAKADPAFLGIAVIFIEHRLNTGIAKTLVAM
jgi:hypothetical protein